MGFFDLFNNKAPDDSKRCCYYCRSLYNSSFHGNWIPKCSNTWAPSDYRIQAANNPRKHTNCPKFDYYEHSDF